MDNTLFLFQSDTLRAETDMQSVVGAMQSQSVVNAIYPERAENIQYLEYKELQHTPLHADMVWLFALSAIVACVVGVVRALSPTFLGQMLSLLFSNFHWRSVVDSFLLQNNVVCKILRLSAYIVGAILLYEIFVATGHTEALGFSGLKLYGIILLCVYIFFLFKYILHSVIGFTFDIPQEITHLLICKKMAICIFAILSFPLAIVFPFVPEDNYTFMIVSIAILAGFVYLWRILKTLKIILTDYLSVFYSFLYLCTVEAIPIAIVCKLAYIAMSLDNFLT